MKSLNYQQSVYHQNVITEHYKSVTWYLESKILNASLLLKSIQQKRLELNLQKQEVLTY